MPGARRTAAPGGTEPHHRRSPAVRALRGAASMVCLSALAATGLLLIVLSLHSKAPVYNGGTGFWKAISERWPRFVVDTPGPLVVAGDFNATFDHRQFRDLLGGGVTDVARATGAGPLRTSPADRAFGPLDGSDHRGIVAGIAVLSPGD